MSGRKRQIFVIGIDTGASVEIEVVKSYIENSIARYDRLLRKVGNANYFHIRHNGHLPKFRVREVESALGHEMDYPLDQGEVLREGVKLVKEIKDALGEENWKQID